jgi:hypothetical protein
MNEVLDRAVAAWRAYSAEPPPKYQETLEDMLNELPLDVQVPIFEAIRWQGYDAFVAAVRA